MAAALLGKCIGLLALVLLFYGCCYAFRIRDGPTQPSPNEQISRSGCDPIFGRCNEKSSSVAGQKWHEIPMQRLASSRKPPVDVTSLEDDDSEMGRERSKLEKTGYARLASARTSRVKSPAVHADNDEDDDDDDDDEEAIVEVYTESAEEDDDDEQVEDSGVDAEESNEKSNGADEEENDEIEDDDDDDVDVDGDDEEEGAEGKDSETSEPEDEAEEKDDSVEDDDKGSDKTIGKKSVTERKLQRNTQSPSKIGKTLKTAKQSKNEDDVEEKSIQERKIKGAAEKGPKKLTPQVISKKKKEDIEAEAGDLNGEDDDDNDDDGDDDDDNDGGDDGDDDGDEEDEDENDEDDEDEEDKAEVATTRPPRKLEKVRLADKDKAKPIQILPTPASPAEKAKVEPKSKEVSKVQETAIKKTADISKQAPESPKKPTESVKKAVESSKKVESPKPMKTEAEAHKTKAPPKSEDKVKAPAKTESTKTPSKPKDEIKETTKATVKKPDVKSTSTKPVEVSRSDKKDSTSKTKRSTHASITLSELNDLILKVPTFVPNFTAVENLECQQHGKIFLRQLRGFKMWALQMLDSNAKVPSGLLRGNVNQYGDFDQCLGVLAHVKIEDKTVKVQGKYCLASIDLYASHPDMKLPVHLMQSRTFIRGSMRDPGHFVPKFTTVNWALCLPAACSAEDAENVLESALTDYNVTAGIKFTIDVDTNMCYVKQRSRPYTKETIGVLYFYAMIVCLVAVATVRDYLVVSEGKGNYSERIIMSFSLRRTVKALLRKGSNEADITCIHGIRALVTFALYIAHRLIPISRLPFSNRIHLTEVANLPISSILRVSLVYTDAFLLLSGVLTAYNIAQEYKTRGEIRWFCRFIARYIRLTPALLVVIFWYAFVMEHIGSGPQWNSAISNNAELCKNNAWTNLLYIQNFFPFEEMCATHTHQLALDMQLSLLAPMLVFFLQFKTIVGILLISFFILLSATLRYIATINNNLAVVIYHGMSIKSLYKTANLTYALPLHRATPYVFGVGLGVLLHYTGKNVKLHKVVAMLGWLIAMALGSWSLFSPWRSARRDYVYDVEEATHYAVICPVAWALALSWFIFACFTNNGGIINKFLSNYWLVLFSRISYAVYLTQFAVFFYNIGTTRYSTEFHLHTLIDTLEVVTVIIASVVLTLLFDIPMQEVKSVIMESTDGLTSGVSAEKKDTAKDKEKPEEKSAESEGIRDRVFEDDEVASTGWDWQKDIVQGGKKLPDETVEDEEQVDMPLVKRLEGRRKSFIAMSPGEEEPMPTYDWIRGPDIRQSRNNDEYIERGRGSRTSQRDYSYDSEEEILEYSRIQQAREEASKRSRRSSSRGFENRRSVSRQGEDDGQHSGRRDERDDPRQYRRSESRAKSVTRDPEDYQSWEFVAKDRPPSRSSELMNTVTLPDEFEASTKQARPPLLRSVDVRRTVSSESEEESGQRKRIEKKHVPVEAKISDEEEWESELRARRKQYMERLSMQEKEPMEEEEGLSSPHRRSSAEGKIALLKDPSNDNVMDSWTISVDPRITQLGSSQEPSEPEDEAVYNRRREYREKGPPSRDDIQSEEESTWDSSRRRSYTSGSQVTSLEEEEEEEEEVEDVSRYNFVLTKGSKRISLQDLSKLSQDEADLSDSGWNVVKKEGAETVSPRTTSSGLYKRESIIKSQASEEDPEYVLPERPKLVQQEREHPFKKAWQMQKSRSEDDGSSAYAIKESKEQLEKKIEDDESSLVQHQSSAEQSEDVEGSLADDESESNTLSQSRSSDTEATKVSSKSGTDETESTSAEHSKNTSFEEKGNAISDTEENSVSFNWPTENEPSEVFKITLRRKSEGTEWNWEPDET